MRQEAVVLRARTGGYPCRSREAPAVPHFGCGVIGGRVRVHERYERNSEGQGEPTKRPGQQLSLAWGRVSAITVTSEHPLNVVSPTDIDRCCPCRHPTSSGYPCLLYTSPSPRD